MKIALITVGKTAYQPFREAIERYASRLPRYIPFELRELPDIKNAKSLSQDQQKRAEGQAILAALQPGDRVTLLDERGKEMTSRQLAQSIANLMANHPGRLVIIIGGPYGFSPEVYARANSLLSLSKLTLPHELAKLLAVEQLYRAMTILKNEPYHHD